MNNKILIELHVPSLNQIYNVYFPINLKVGEIVELLNKGLFDLSKEIYKETNNYLYDELGDIYNFDLFIHETKMKNGSMLILL